MNKLHEVKQFYIEKKNIYLFVFCGGKFEFE